MSAPRPNLSKYVPLEQLSARTERVWLGVADRLERGQRPRARRTFQLFAACAALALAFATGSLVTWMRTPSGWARLETAGEAVSVELHDGSRLTLQRQTRVELRESSTEKVELELEQGHLDCVVSANPRRTFAVAAADFEVVVMGTQFGVDLSREQQRLEVVVQAGNVDVRRRRQTRSEVVLHAGQRWSFDLLAAKSASSPAAPSSATGEQASAPDVSASTQDAGATSREPAPVEPTGAPPPASTLRSSASEGQPRRREPGAAPSGARQLLDQGNAARRAGDLGAASRAYERLLSTFPTDARAGLAAFELGRLRMDRLGDVRGAVAALEQAATRVTDPGLREDAMARLVRAFDLLGEQERCLDARGQYLEAHPTGVHVGSVAESCNLKAP